MKNSRQVSELQLSVWHRIVVSLWPLVGLSAMSVALAEENPVIVVSDPVPRHFFLRISPDEPDSAIGDAQARMEGEKRRRTGVFRIDVDALKADHRHVDIIIKNGREERFDWCIGERVLFTPEVAPNSQTYEMISTSVVEAPDGTTWSIYGAALDGEGSFEILVFDDNKRASGTIRIGTRTYEFGPIGRSRLHRVYRVF